MPAPAKPAFSLPAHRGRAIEEDVSFSSFLGQELIASLGGLDADRVLGPWRGSRPGDRRQKLRFRPAEYGEDDAHGHAELCLLLAGRCGFSYDHAACRLNEGDLVVLPGQLPHAESYWRARDGYRLAWWVLSGDDPGLHITRYSARDGFVLDYVMRLGTLPADASRRLQWLREMTGFAEAPDVEMLREALLTVTLALYRRILGGGGEHLDNRGTLVQRAADFVRAHAGAPLELAEVARAVRVSPNYLTGLFRTETGTPLGRFVLEERIALAKRKLGEPMATVKCVALDLGFGDPFAFSRAFKRVTGHSPRAWMAANGVNSNMGS
jgi:AraC-like DNA-binding protein